MKKYFYTLIGILIKSKAILSLVKVAKTAKSAKVLVSFISMFISAILYGWKLGIGFGIGFVGLIFIHELGHVWALKKQGYKASLPLFIPFFGAVIFSPPMHDREEEALNGFMGPLWGTIGTIIPLLLLFIWPAQKELMILLVYVGLWINLFNLLLIIRPFDGGRVLQLLGSWYKWIGLTVIITMLIVLKSVGLLFILLLALEDFDLHIKKKLLYSVLIAVALIIGEMFQWQGWLTFVLTNLLLFIIVFATYYTQYKPYLELKKVIDDTPDDVKKLADSVSMTEVHKIQIPANPSSFQDFFLISQEDRFKYSEYLRAQKKIVKYTGTNKEDTRPYPVTATKIKWVVYWVLLTALLICGMIIITPYMPVIK